MIEIDRATKVYEADDGETVTALEEVTAPIRPGSFVSIVGPSGCGKSTLLRLIAGLTPLTGGRILIEGEPVARPRTDVGIVFQAPTLLPWASILANVTFPLRLLGRNDAAGEARALALLAMAGLSGFEHRRPRELSGGMQQRAAICRALVHEPRILLMDEPFGALDALTREEMALELLRLWTERPATTVFVTHSITEAVILSDQVLVMTPRPGRLADVIDISLPRPRGFRQVSTPEFERAADRIRGHIFGGKPAAPERVAGTLG